MSISEFTPSDQEIRLLATHQPLKNLSIEAGAGTGKTTLLSERYVNTLLEKKVPIGQCVAITFTEKAALELKQRIHDLLIEKDHPGLAQEAYNAPISTIHAFCSNLLHQKPYAAGIDPGFSQLDPLQQQDFLNTCFDKFLNQCLNPTEASQSHTDPGEVLKRLYAYDLPLKKIKTLCLQAYDNRAYFLHNPLKSFSWPDTATFIQSLLNSYTKLWELAQAQCKNKEDLAYKNLQAMLNKLQYLSQQSFIEQLVALMFQVKIYSNKGALKNWDDKKTLKYIKETLSHLKQQHENFQQQLGHCIASDTLFFLKSFVEHVNHFKQNQSILDFDDLLTLSLNLIKNDSSVRNYFKHTYRCFFIDEFQDTDPIQKQIIWALSALYDKQSQQSVFIVGDPKQSIYRFRGASLETYAQATQDFKEKDLHKPIVQNFRSSQKILDWVNACFSSLLKNSYHSLQALPFHLGKDPAIVSIESKQDYSELDSHTVLQKEAHSIARYIKQILNQEEAFIFDKKTNQYRKAQAKDIAIIYPTSTHLDYLEESLRKQGIVFLSQGSRSFFKRSEIEGFIHILHALANPDSSIALASALKSCYLGLDDQDLFSLFHNNAELCLFDLDNTFIQDFKPRIKNALLCLQYAYASLNQNINYSLQALVRVLIKQCSVFDILSLRKHRQQAFANVEKFLLMAQYYELSVSSHLYDFTLWCLSNQDKRHDQPEALLSSQDINAVQLMTMHKSKGLEFPIVIMAQLASKSMPYPNFLVQSHAQKYGFGFSHSGQSMYTQSYVNMLKYERSSLTEEKKRLLYVACTRAKDRLVISRFAKKSYKDSYHALIESAIAQTKPLITVFNADTIETEQDKNPLKHPISAENNDLNFVWPSKTLVANQIASSLSGVDKMYKQSDNLDSKKELASKLNVLEKNSLGSLFHKVMQDLGNLNFDIHSLDKIFTHHSVAPSDQEKLLPMVESCLEHPLLKKAMQAEQCFTEYPLLTQDNHDGYRSMYVDLLFYDGLNWTLLDYKTDAVEKKDAQTHAARYQNQMKLYAQTLKTYDIQIKQAHIYFVHIQTAVTLNV